MKLTHKYYLIFFFVFLAILFGGYASINTSEKMLEKSIKESSLLFIQDTLDEVDITILKKIELFQEYSRDLILRESVAESNREFEKLENIQEYLDKKDREWISVPKETITPFMQDLINNEAAEEIREKTEFYKQKYDFPVFAEVIVTNKYGANVAITNKTTDYRQDDEKWWQVSKKEGIYTKEIEYDESAGVFSLDLGIRIDDGEGNFLGVFKVVYNVEEIIEELKHIISRSEILKKHNSAVFTLVNREGRVIFSTGNYKSPAHIAELLPLEHFKDKIPAIEKKNTSRGKILVVHGHLRGYRDFKGIGWSAIVELDVHEIFKPVETLQKTILIITLFTAFAAVAIGFFLSKNVVYPILKLSKTAKAMREGNFDFPLDLETTKGEIGELTDSFIKMRSELKDVLDNLQKEITEHKRTEEALSNAVKEVQTIMDVNPDIFYVHNMEGKLIKWNKGLEELTGLTPDKLMLRPALDFVHEEDRPLVMKKMQEVFERGKSAVEARFFSKEGLLVPFFCNAVLLRNDTGEVVGFTGIGKNMSTQKVAEEALRKSKEELEEKVRERTVQLEKEINERELTQDKLSEFADELEWKNLFLEQAKEEAEKATQLKEKFVSLVAHDLKAPLTSVIGFLNLIYDDTDHPLQPEQKAMFEIILKSSKKMVAMIDQILEISRLQSGTIQLKLEFIDGHFIGGTVTDSLCSLATKKGVVLTNDIPRGTRLYADHELFYGAIQNLVSNAIKFCKNGDQVNLFVPPGQKGAIAVKDTGAGISDAMLPDLFKHEIKTSARGTAGESGTGFGLPFAHDIMKAHKGSLRVESELGKGSVFYAELPYVQPRILVVDDEPDARMVLKRLLQKIDTDIVEAGNGEEALEVLNRRDIHLIISDIRMPVVDGFELLEKTKKEPGTKDIPFILVTDKVLESQEKAFQLGANEFIIRPVDMERFVRKVTNFVK